MYDAIATEKIGLLRELGTQLSLDDFGTGYSSLSYLRQLDVDQLKIDQSFVRYSTCSEYLGRSDSEDHYQLAHNFHLNIIAEGVETEYQLAFLKENGCKVFQGYLFGKPLPIEEMESLLDKYPCIVDKPIFNIPNYTSIKYTCILREGLLNFLPQGNCYGRSVGLRKSPIYLICLVSCVLSVLHFILFNKLISASLENFYLIVFPDTI